MRIKAVELYKPHVLGYGKDLEQGLNGLPVYPIATGKFAERRMDCKTIVVPADYTSSKVVVAISKFHLSEYESTRRNRQRGWGNYTPKVKYPRTQRERENARMTLEQFEEKFGKELLGWEWEVKVVNAAALMPADAYNEARFFVEERQAKIDIAANAWKDAAALVANQARATATIIRDEFEACGLYKVTRDQPPMIFYRADSWGRPDQSMHNRRGLKHPEARRYDNQGTPWNIEADGSIRGDGTADGRELADVLIRRKKALVSTREYLTDATVKMPADKLIGLLLPKQQKRIQAELAKLVDLDEKMHEAATAYHKANTCEV